jgi:hypothetical protein
MQAIKSLSTRGRTLFKLFNAVPSSRLPLPCAQARNFSATQSDPVSVKLRKTEIRHMCKGALPLDRAGTALLPKLPPRDMVEDYLVAQHVTEDILTDHFSAMFQKFLTHTLARDYDKLSTVVEPRFLAQLRGQSEHLGKFDMRFEPSGAQENKNYLVDSMLIKGVRANREENDSNHDYMYVDSHENLGLRFYLHKYFLGFHPYYMETQNKAFFENARKDTPQTLQEKLSQEDGFRDIFFRQRKEFNERSLSLVLRCTFMVTEYGKLTSVSGPESLYDPQYSGNHIAIFECQLKTPPSLALIDHGFFKYIKLQKMNMSNWRLVDVDHFMKGNSFFSSHVSGDEWHSSVESTIGTSDQRNKHIKDPDQAKEVRQIVSMYKNYIDLKEPRSNRGLEEFKSKEDLEAEKKAAQERAQQKLAEAAAKRKKEEVA